MNKINAVYVSLLALVVALAALIVSVVMGQKSSEAVDVAASLKANPVMVVEALQAYETQVREEAQKKAEELIQSKIEELNNNANDGVLGNPGGEIVLVEFVDFSCGYCHRVYPAIKNLIAKNGDLKVVAKPLAFLSPVSSYAAKAAVAAKEQGKFAEVFSALIESKEPLTEAKVDEIAVLAGVDLAQLKTDMNSEKVQDTLKETNQLAGELQINGVPTLILNGQIIQALDEEILQNAIDAIK